MVPPAQFTAISDVCLDRYLAVRPQPFLRRNLRKVLDRHQEELESLRATSQQVPAPATYSRSHILDLWSDYPFEGLKALLKSMPSRFAHSGVTMATTNDLRIGKATNDDCEVLLRINSITVRPKAGHSFHRAKRLNSVNGELHSSQTQPEFMLQDEYTCTLLACDGTDNPLGSSATTITGTLSYHGDVIRFKPQSKISVPVYHRNGDPRRWQRGTKTSLKLRIESSSSKLGNIGMLSGPRQTVSTPIDEATYHVLSAIRLESPSECAFDQKVEGNGDALVEMRVGIWSTNNAEVRIEYAWKRSPSPTPFMVFNTAASQQLPTPDASQHSRTVRRHFAITYKWMKTRRLVQWNLHCPLCQKDLAIRSFPRLRLHLQLHHEYFEFHVEEQGLDDDEDDQYAFRRTILITLAKQSDKPDGQCGEEDMIDWVAPRQPFDLKSHLRNNRSPWLTSSTKVAKRQLDISEPVEFTWVRKPPEEVEDLIPPPLPVHSAPFGRHKETRFYRTTSKNPVQPGEMLNDSDNDLDESWTIERTKQNINALRLKDSRGEAKALSAIQRQFMVQWNTHIDKEIRLGMNGVRYKRESIIRFAREHQYMLRHMEWQQTFDHQLQYLVKQKLCDQEDAAYCLALEHEPPRSGAASISADVDTAGAVCRCGEKAFGNRGVIYCSNEKCPHDAFHLRCFNLQSRPDDWWCPDCLTPTGG